MMYWYKNALAMSCNFNILQYSPEGYAHHTSSFTPYLVKNFLE